MTRTFQPAEFLEALQTEQLGNSFSIDGIAKQSEDKNALMFDPSFAGDAWISIPLSIIESVDYRDSRVENMTTSIIVRLNLRIDPKESLAAHALFNLLRSRLVTTSSDSVTESYYDFGAQARVQNHDTSRIASGFGFSEFSGSEALDKAIRAAIQNSGGGFSPEWTLLSHRTWHMRGPRDP